MLEIVGRGLDLLQQSLRPFVEAELRARHGDQWRQVADAAFPGEPPREEFDIAALLQIIERTWSTVFVSRLSQNDRSAVGELRGVRNAFVQQRPFSTPDLMRALDAMQRLMRAIGQTSVANDVARLKNTIATPPTTAVRRPSTSIKPRSTSRSASAPTSTSTSRTSAEASSGSSFTTPKPAPLAPAAQFTPTPAPERVQPPRVTAGPAAWAAEMDEITEAFTGQFGRTFRSFGTPALGMLGINDAVAGVQWSCSRDLQTGQVRLSVNLEGMQYDGWPVARVIERELADPQLPALAASLKAAEIVVSWARDCWQGASRLKIVEADIAPTPLSLDELTPDKWRAALEAAQQCLDPERQFRGRGRQVVTTIASRTTEAKDVSPHFTFTTLVTSPEPGGNWDAALKDPVARLEPLHTWLTDRASA